jgi:hypothetical protein
MATPEAHGRRHAVLQRFEELFVQHLRLAVAGLGNTDSTLTRYASLIAKDKLSVSVIILALLASVGLGAVHALSPGHGKTIVGTYLVGSRGTWRHALLLALTVTVTHTSPYTLYSQISPAGQVPTGTYRLFFQRLAPQQAERIGWSAPNYLRRLPRDLPGHALGLGARPTGQRR